MEVLFIALGATLAVAVAGLSIGFIRRGKAHQRWKSVLTEAAGRLPGSRPSPGTRYDGPELRAEVEGYTVSLSVKDAAEAPDRGEAKATVALGSSAPSSRLWLGWDEDQAPPDWHHVQPVSVEAHRVDGRVVARSDDAAFAQRVLDSTYLDLLDVRREARAHAAILSVRGGYLELRYRGIEVSAHLIERLVKAAARIASELSKPA